MVTSRVSASVLLGLLAWFPGNASAEDLIRIDELVKITVAESRPYTMAHTITITAGDPVFARTTEELGARSWSATRVSERGTETINSESCPALRTVALSFANLPALRIRPMSAIAWGGEPDGGLPMQPTMKDGFETRLSFATRGEDNSPATIEMSGGGAYQRWGHDSVGALLACWGGLVP